MDDPDGDRTWTDDMDVCWFVTVTQNVDCVRDVEGSYTSCYKQR